MRLLTNTFEFKISYAAFARSDGGASRGLGIRNAIILN